MLLSRELLTIALQVKNFKLERYRKVWVLKRFSLKREASRVTNELRLTGVEIAFTLIKRSCPVPVKPNLIIKLHFIRLSTMRLRHPNVADEALWFGLLSLQNSSQLDSGGINNPVDVLFSVVDVRRESHSAAFLGGYPMQCCSLRTICRRAADLAQCRSRLPCANVWVCDRLRWCSPRLGTW